MIHILPWNVYLGSAPRDKTFITYLWDLFRPPYQISVLNRLSFIRNLHLKCIHKLIISILSRVTLQRMQYHFSADVCVSRCYTINIAVNCAVVNEILMPVKIQPFGINRSQTYVLRVHIRETKSTSRRACLFTCVALVDSSNIQNCPL